jgi:8-oxo-dGTP pyrophosphatase MutT (NUDIX family)
MEPILRGRAGWMEAIADALARAERPIPFDPRFTPREAQRPTDMPRYDRAAFPPARPAATLLAIYPGEGGELTVPLTVRRADLRAHAGEVSLPGGAVDPADAGPEATALREAVEEIGLDATAVQVLGQLDEVWIPVSNFELRPFVGALAARPRLVPAADEVAAVVELPLRSLLAPDAVTQEEIEIGGWTLSVAVYRHAGQRIWGATARTLAMFASVLRDVGLGG